MHVGFPVPQTLLLCNDASVIGTAVDLMEYVKVIFTRVPYHCVMPVSIVAVQGRVYVTLPDICHHGNVMPCVRACWIHLCTFSPSHYSHWA